MIVNSGWGNTTRGGMYIFSDSDKSALYAKADRAAAKALNASSKNGIGVRSQSEFGYSGLFIGGTFEVQDWSNNTTFRIEDDGNIAVGNVGLSYTADYKLYVEKGIHTGRIKTDAALADYVFEEDYELLTLAEVDTFIQAHHHLPGVVSQAEVDSAGGVELTGFTIQLQEKLEELYLHVIDMEKRMQTLEAEKAQLQAKLEAENEGSDTSATSSQASPKPAQASLDALTPQSDSHE